MHAYFVGTLEDSLLGGRRASAQDLQMTVSERAGLPSSGHEDFVSELGDFVTRELGLDKSEAASCVFCKMSFGGPFPNSSFRANKDGKCEVKLLHCLHSACGSCLEESLRENTEVLCPMCDSSTGERDYYKYLCNFAAHQGIDFMAKEGKHTFSCDECVEASPAVHHCETCVLSLCLECSEHHRRAKMTSMHCLVVLGEQKEHAMHRAAFCAAHRDQTVEFFCETCNIMCCRECIITDHETHNYKLPVGGLVEQQRKVVRDQIQQLHILATDLQERHQALTEVMKDFDQDLDAARTNLENLETHVLDALQERRQAMLKEVEVLAAGHHSRFGERRAVVTSQMVSMWRVIDFVEKVLARGTAIEVLFLKSYISTHLPAVLEIKDQEDDISEMPGALPSVDWHGQFHGLRETLRSLGDVKLEHTLPLRPTNKFSGKSVSNPDIPRWADTADSYDPWFVEESKTKSRKSSRSPIRDRAAAPRPVSVERRSLSAEKRFALADEPPTSSRPASAGEAFWRTSASSVSADIFDICTVASRTYSGCISSYSFYKQRSR